MNQFLDHALTLLYNQNAVFSPTLSPDFAVFMVKSLKPSNCLNMNSEALFGYTCSIPNGPGVRPIGTPAGVMGMDTIVGVCAGEFGAPPGILRTGRLIRGGRSRPSPLLGEAPSTDNVTSDGDDDMVVDLSHCVKMYHVRLCLYPQGNFGVKSCSNYHFSTSFCITRMH